jgi:hypothetical protein
MTKKDFFNFVVAMISCILTYPLLFIVLIGIFGYSDPSGIKFVTILIGSILGGLFACLFYFIKPLFK